jgi:hypothetical protein
MEVGMAAVSDTAHVVRQESSPPKLGPIGQDVCDTLQAIETMAWQVLAQIEDIKTKLARFA